MSSCTSRDFSEGFASMGLVYLYWDIGREISYSRSGFIDVMLINIRAALVWLKTEQKFMLSI
jgi:hypothetical protein